MKITNKEQVKIGQSYTQCCHLDLAVIEKNDDLEDVIDNFYYYYVWETRKEALEEIAQWWTKDSKEYKECIDLIKAIEL